MSEYEGLNLPQLLDLMHELVYPEPVSWMPQTPGWWVLSGWLLATILLGIRQVVKHRRRNRYRREALAILKTIELQADSSPPRTAEQIASLLKRTALVAYPRQQVAHLHGAQWAQFLCDSSGDDPKVREAAGRLAVAAYRSDADGKTLCEPARRWLRVHRA